MSRQFSGSGGAVMPAQAAHWSYAVPSNDGQQPPAPTSGLVAQPSQTPRPRLPLSHTPNGNARPKTRNATKSFDGLNGAYTSGGLKPPLREQSGGSGDTSEADSLLDLYRPRKDNLRSTSHDRQRVKRKGSRGSEAALRDVPGGNDGDKWIHRDKLQQIEIQEMIAAGRGISLPSRSASRIGTKLSQNSSVDLGNDVQDGNGPYAGHDNKRQRMKSPTLSSEDFHEEMENIPGAEGESGAANAQGATQPYRPRRPSVSRIPVKGATFADTASHARARSGSQTSQNMPDTTARTPNSQSPQGSLQGSPSKQRIANKTGGSARGRNVSRGGRLGQTGRPLTASSPTNDASPQQGTAGSRPPTARPEGDPPWINSMFKPDPRLPQDQQMLPTHAKRLAAQKNLQQAFDPNASPRKHDDLVLMDDDVQPGQAYGNEDYYSQESDQSNRKYLDRNVATSPSPDPSSRPEQKQQHESRNRESLNSQRVWSEGRRSPAVPNPDDGQWPLRSLGVDKYAGEQPAYTSPKSESGSWAPTRPNPPSENGSYSLMPTIPGQQRDMEQRLSQRSGNSNPSRLSGGGSVPGQQLSSQPVRLPVEAEDEREKRRGDVLDAALSCDAIPLYYQLLSVFLPGFCFVYNARWPEFL